MKHQQAQWLLSEVLSHQKRVCVRPTVRVGLSGPPGAGKSTLIETLGFHLAETTNHKVAVLVRALREGGRGRGGRGRMERGGREGGGVGVGEGEYVMLNFCLGSGSFVFADWGVNSGGQDEDDPSDASPQCLHPPLPHQRQSGRSHKEHQ